MQIDEFVKVDNYDASVGLAFEPKWGGTHYGFIVADNSDGVITKLERLVDGVWELIDEEPPVSLQALVRHRPRGFA